MKLLLLLLATMLSNIHSMCPNQNNMFDRVFNNICAPCNPDKSDACSSRISQTCSSYVTPETETKTTTRIYTPSPIVIIQTVNVTKSCTPPSSSCPAHPTPTMTECFTVAPPSQPAGNPNTSATTASATGGDITGLAVLGSFTVLLALLLVVTITGWIYTATRGKKYKATVLSNKNSGHVIGIHNPAYGVGTLAGSDDQSVVQCNTQAPEYERVAIDNTNGYDVVDRSVPRPPPVSHTHNNDQDYSVLESEGMQHDYHVLDDTAGGGPLSGGGVQDYEVPISRRK